jgi:hypothetical protein
LSTVWWQFVFLVEQLAKSLKRLKSYGTGGQKWPPVFFDIPWDERHDRTAITGILFCVEEAFALAASAFKSATFFAISLWEVWVVLQTLVFRKGTAT